MKKKLYVGTNNKMTMTIAETKNFITELRELTADISRDEMRLFVIPSYTAISAAADCAGDGITIGAQNMCWEERGQFTGEISPLMLEEVGAALVMTGHSERRHIFRETDEEENKKVISALTHGFISLLCIGETGEEKARGESDEALRRQIIKGFLGVNPSYIDRGMIWVAYEPVWAIGVGGKPAEPEYVFRRHEKIREALAFVFGIERAEKVPILYGGSVNNENAPKLIAGGDVDGLFIGRSAWRAENFSSIIREVLPVFKVKEK
ncbi:MAG: triose-phosphate isomerase [Oscillospiraceae bacterium]